VRRALPERAYRRSDPDVSDGTHVYGTDGAPRRLRRWPDRRKDPRVRGTASAGAAAERDRLDSVHHSLGAHHLRAHSVRAQHRHCPGRYGGRWPSPRAAGAPAPASKRLGLRFP